MGGQTIMGKGGKGWRENAFSQVQHL